MFTKLITLLTALPITIALSGNAEALGVSKAAKERSTLCESLKKIKDPNDKRRTLLKFCDRTTFHCTTHRKGGLFGKVNGVCDDPNLCKDSTLYKACEQQCVINRERDGIKDKKSEQIKGKLASCPVNPKVLGKPDEYTGQAPKDIAPPQQQSPIIAPIPEDIAPPVEQSQQDDSMTRSRKRSTSMVQQQPPVIDPTPENVETAPVDQSSSIPVPPPMTEPGMIPPPPMIKPSGKQQDLLSQIREGKQLKKSSETPTPKGEDGRQDLLSQIREGKQLKKASERVLPEGKEPTKNDLFSSLQKRMGEIRKDVAPDDEEDSQDENSEDWD